MKAKFLISILAVLLFTALTGCSTARELKVENQLLKAQLEFCKADASFKEKAYNHLQKRACCRVSNSTPAYPLFQGKTTPYVVDTL